MLHFPQRHHSHCPSLSREAAWLFVTASLQSHWHAHSSQTQSDCRDCRHCRRSRLGCFESARRTGYIVGRTACWICWPTLYFQLYRSLRFESDARRCQKNLMPESDRFRIRRHCWHRSARARNQLHSTHAWTILILSSPCFPYNLFYFCVNHCVCASYCEVNQINKHKHRFVVVNNTFEIVAIRSVCERKTPSEQADVKSTRRRTEMSASINMVNFNHQTLFSGKPLP